MVHWEIFCSNRVRILLLDGPKSLKSKELCLTIASLVSENVINLPFIFYYILLYVFMYRLKNPLKITVVGINFLRAIILVYFHCE
jgi:hypothetical protein